jgi:hypothetical protein
VTLPTRLPEPPLSAWALLLSGLSQTAIGAGLLLGRAAQLVERPPLTAPPRYALAATPLNLTELGSAPSRAPATQPPGNAL